MSRLLEKPFDLQDLNDAVHRALADNRGRDEPSLPIAAMNVSFAGEIQFVSDRATEMFAAVGLSAEGAHLGDVFEGETMELLAAVEEDWVEVRPRTRLSRAWLMRTRKRATDLGWLVVFYARDEEQRRTDPRMRILLDERAGSTRHALIGSGPVIVIESDGVVPRLSVSQIEWVGAICYPSDDLASAVRLLAAVPRARTVLIDFALAGSDMGP